RPPPPTRRSGRGRFEHDASWVRPPEAWMRAEYRTESVSPSRHLHSGEWNKTGEACCESASSVKAGPPPHTRQDKSIDTSPWPCPPLGTPGGAAKLRPAAPLRKGVTPAAGRVGDPPASPAARFPRETR